MSAMPRFLVSVIAPMFPGRLLVLARSPHPAQPHDVDRVVHGFREMITHAPSLRLRSI
jgi:hypothetical protein